jgi:hypothetical protein
LTLKSFESKAFSSIDFLAVDEETCLEILKQNNSIFLLDRKL